MADLKVEGAELKTLVKLGKKRSLSFGFCPGGKSDHTLLIDRRKSPEMLGKLARQEGSSPKVAFGTFEVKGRTMEMTCGRTVPQMAKVLKKYLKSQKITINVVVLDAEGNTVDSDVEDLAPDPSMEDDDADAAIEDDADDKTEAPEPATAADDEGPEAADDDAQDGTLDAASLAARLKALKPAVVGAEPDIAAKLGKVMAAAVAQIKAATLEQADATVTALENAVARLGNGAPAAEPAPAADGEADFKALAVRAQALKGAIEGIPAPAKDKLMAALTDAVKQIRDRNHDAAATILGKIETAVGKLTAAASTSPAEEKTAPADVAPYVQSRDAWIETRRSLRQEMENLKSAIDAATANAEGFEDVPKKSGILLDHIADIDTGLETTLDQLVKTPDDAKREELKAGARKIIETYRGVLDTDFFKAVDNNGFIKTNIRGSALDSLQKVSAALSA